MSGHRAPGRTLLIGLISAVSVIAIALIVSAATGTPPEDSSEAEGTRLTITSGPTGRPGAAVPEEGDRRILDPSPSRVEPATEQWLALLPRLETAVEDAPDDILAKRKLAIAYYNLGRLSEASALYEDLLVHEDDPVLRNRLGNTLRDLGRVAEAEAQYRAALTADHTLAAAYLNLAELLWRSGRQEEALAVIDEGSTRVPEDKRDALLEGRASIEGSTTIVP